MVLDVADRVVEPPQGLGDPLPGRVVRQFDGLLQAEADVIEAADNPVEQFPSPVALPRGGGGTGEVGEVGAWLAVCHVPDYGHDEMPGRGRHRAEADPHRERARVLTQPDKPGPRSHLLGGWLLLIVDAGAEVRRAQLDGDQRFDWLADKFPATVAEHLPSSLVNQHEASVVVGE